jgi:MFS family permease
MALKAKGSLDWQMSLQLTISSLGMFLVLYLGGLMANRRKMPFVLVPGFAFSLCCLLMAFSRGVLPFLILFGLSTLFETICRPAVAAIIRTNYPATHRGSVTGEIRKWCSVVFLSFSLLSAYLLDAFLHVSDLMIKSQLILAGFLSACSFLAFRTIRTSDALPSKTDSSSHLASAWHIIRHDSRFRFYMVVGTIYATGGMIFASFVPVLLSKPLKCSYLTSSILLHILPGVLSFLSTGLIGRWIDRSNPWKAWSWIRLGWGIDPLLLALTPALMLVAPPLALAVAGLARVARGLVMGGSWILWWQVGVNHFAPPGGDTSRYMGILLFANGIARLIGPIMGAWLLSASSLQSVFLLGGGVVILSSLLSFRQLHRESVHRQFATVKNFEDQFIGS